MTEPRERCSCGARIGEPHGDCDVARCLWTGIQRVQCGLGLAADCCRVLRDAGHDDLAQMLADYMGLDDPDHDCGNEVWTGRWPGEADCERLGFWCYWGPPWVRCGPDHPDAEPDLNRLIPECVWDREAGRWELRTQEDTNG